jgi:hypothetical protein
MAIRDRVSGLGGWGALDCGPFRFKPQGVGERPRISAPYQPRFDWNLWFAFLGDWEQNPLVPLTELRLLEGDRAVLGLFAGDPSGGRALRLVRAVLWRYWFTSRGADGRLETVQETDVLPEHG